MDLTCFLHPGWQPLIRPASAQRDWMDRTSEAFAYRCLPLTIANAHGWELLNPCGFEAFWNGGGDRDAVTLRHQPQAEGGLAPAVTSLFGHGIITFHVPGIFRTEPGWNLWVGGSPNQPKDGIAPLTGVVETDWSPFTFTMNWQFTRANHWIRFDAGEPICFLFPVQRALLEDITPKLLPIDAEPQLAQRFQDWSRGRDAFVARMDEAPPAAAADKWQKHYYRGTDISGEPQVADHRTKLRLRDFDASAIPWPLPPIAGAGGDVPAAATPTAAPVSMSQDLRDLRKREWLLETLERQRDIAETPAEIERRADLSRDEFRDRYYALNRPVILTGEMVDWPALRWTPDDLKRRVGDAIVEYQGDRARNAAFEIDKAAHRREMPFDRFIDLVTEPGSGNDAYITAFNSARNAQALAPLAADLGFADKFLARDAEQPHGMMWIGPADTLTPLHHDLTNNLIAQIVGRKRLLILPASEVGRLYNHLHVFSEIADLDDPALSVAQFPRLAGARVFEVELQPGEMIFLPVGWWHQVRALDFSVTVTSMNFLWPNDAYKSYPAW